MKVATYLESWAVPFSVSSNNDISNLDANIDTVYLAFAKPDNTYKKGDFTFSNTGLNFSLDFKVVVESIRLLKKRKVRVESFNCTRINLLLAIIILTLPR